TRTAATAASAKLAALADSPVVTPRKRGRPPKSDAAAKVATASPPPTTPRRRGRPSKSDAAAKAATTAKAKSTPAADSDSDDQVKTPTARSSAGAKKSQAAPPDTVGLTRRARPVASSSKTVAADVPKTKKPRGGARTKPVAVVETAEDSEEDKDNDAVEDFADILRGASPDEYDSPNEMVLIDTPSKKVTLASPLLFTRSRPQPSKAGFAQDIDNASPVPTLGRKRKASADELPSSPAIQRPPAKRGRPKKAQVPEPEVEVDDELEAESGDQQIPVPPARIRAAPVVVSPRHDVFVDIVSPSRFEKSRARISSAKQAEANSSVAKDDDIKWRKKYEDLCALRQSQPEKEYAELKKSSQVRFDAADALIEQLRSDI
ncbi:hypothetical protein IWW38_005970, partial [Coemansia aciculifera]